LSPFAPRKERPFAERTATFLPSPVKDSSAVDPPREPVPVWMSLAGTTVLLVRTNLSGRPGAWRERTGDENEDDAAQVGRGRRIEGNRN